MKLEQLVGIVAVIGMALVGVTGCGQGASRMDDVQPGGGVGLESLWLNDGGSTGDGGAVDAGPCTPGQVACTGNTPETCSSTGQWVTGTTCTNQTCVSGACTGTCAPGQTNPLACGNCGTDTQTCGASGTWQDGTCSNQRACAPNATQACHTYGTQTCGSSCGWGQCSCPSGAVCAPGATQCSNNGVQTCDSCGQWADDGSSSRDETPSRSCRARERSGAGTGRCDVGTLVAMGRRHEARTNCSPRSGQRHGAPRRRGVRAARRDVIGVVVGDG